MMAFAWLASAALAWLAVSQYRARIEADKRATAATALLHKTEATLNSTSRRLRHASETGGAMMWERDLTTGDQWTSVGNPELYGETHDSWLGLQSLLDVMHPEDRESFINSRASIDLNEGIENEFRAFHADGRTMHMRTRCRLVEDQGGRFLIGATTDVTKDIDRAEELERLNSQLEQANTDLNDFAHVLSHDLRSPLRGIRTLLNFLDDDAGQTLTPIAKGYIEKIDGRVDRMQNLVNDLASYALAGHSSHKPSPTDPMEIAAEIQSVMGIPDGLVFSARSSVDLVTVQRTPLTTCIRNLVDNALKHHKPGPGSVDVVFSHDSTDGGSLLVDVIDDGPGIAPEFRDQIFEPFRKLESKDAVEGSGIGLAMVRRIASRAGATISLESEIGVGSTFRIKWPLATPKAQISDAAISKTPRPNLQTVSRI